MIEPKRSLQGPYETVFLDVGETLVHLEPSFASTVRAIGLDFGLERVPNDFDEGLRAMWASHVRATRSSGHSLTTGTSRRYWHQTYARVGVFLGVDDVEGFSHALYQRFTSYAAYAPMSGAIDVLRCLNRLGLRVIVASNWEGWLGRLLAELGLDRFFAGQAVSADVGFEKPDRRFFDAALEISGSDRSRTVHVGDGLEADVKGALSSGIDAVWLSSSGAKDAPVPVISSITELPGVLEPYIAPVSWVLPPVRKVKWT
jgi:HAD superfamily hydrolase (TIGR01549 family)